MKNKVALIFVFNHRYDSNINILESIYSPRFSNIYHLIPFYSGDKNNVIPVYENSFYFQGYLAQGLKHYFGEEYEHYIFVADDLILNPLINENNYKEYFKVEGSSSYIPEIFNLHNFTNNNTLRFNSFKTGDNNEKLYWWRIREVIKYRHEKYGVENKNEMPSYGEAATILAEHGYPIQPLTHADVFGGLFPTTLPKHEKVKHVARYLFNLRTKKRTFNLAYPLVGSFSDIVIVSAASIKKFCHYCGVFASNKLFVEFAIPTALLLSSLKVITEPSIGKRGDIYWTYTAEDAEHYQQNMKLYSFNLKKLLHDFPGEKLYIHPIKLTKWKNDIES